MASKPETVVIRAKLSWAKVLGEPRMNKFSEEKEWSVDATPLRKEDLDTIKRVGITNKLKSPSSEKDTRTEKFLSFRQKEYRVDPKTGERKRQPISVVDAAGKPWGDALIGNDSIGDVKFTVRDYGPGKHKGVYIQAIRVLDLVEFERQEFAPLSSDDEYFAGSHEDEATDDTVVDTDVTNNPDDLDDEIPF